MYANPFSETFINSNPWGWETFSQEQTRKKRTNGWGRTTRRSRSSTADSEGLFHPKCGGVSQHSHARSPTRRPLPAEPQLINTTINAGQFAGLPSEDPLAHLRKFLRIADTARFNGTPLNITRLSLFPFSLMGKAYDWIAGLPDNSITTWEECTTKVLNKYFPPGRTSQMKNEIVGFRQFEQESLAEAWEKFQDLLRRYPHHGLEKG